MEKKSHVLLTVILLSCLLGAGAGILSSTLTSRSIESYAAELLTDERYISLIPRSLSTLPGTYEDSVKANREASLRSLAEILPHKGDGLRASEWLFPDDVRRFGLPVSSDGWILTTASAYPLRAVASDTDVYVQGTRYSIDRVVRDPRSDLVLLKLKDASQLPTVSFGKPEDVLSGSMLFAWEALEEIRPFVLTAADADVTYGVSLSEEFTTTWQGDSSIPSGTPIFSPQGELLGFSEGEAEIFPLHHSLGFVQDVLKTGSPRMATLGVYVLDLSRAYNVSSTLTHERHEGALIISPLSGASAVIPGSPGEDAGLLKEDILTDVDGTALTHAETLAEILSDYEPGEIANIRILRKGEPMTISVTLGEETNP